MTRTHRFTTLMLVAVALLVATGTADAKQFPEEKCQKGRHDAAAKYTQCHQKLLGTFFGGAIKDDAKFQAALWKCPAKYTATWLKLQKKTLGTGATCDQYRFENNGDGTVTDWLTGLQWELKTVDGTVHDKDNVYSWSVTPPAADGTAFTSFLFQLNFALGCFAGQCDWRLPTLAELQTILLEPYPCAKRPCIDQAVFGATAASAYWSATTYATFLRGAWYADFGGGNVNAMATKAVSTNVRAVRAGL